MLLLGIANINANSRGGCFKFIRLKYGEFLFTEVVPGNTLSHKDMAKKTWAGTKGITDAGVIFTFPDYWRLEESYSTTLKIGCSEQALEDLKKLITQPYDEEA